MPAMNNEYIVLLQALTEAFGSSLKTVVLFGSRARGEAGPDSDHDIFLVAEDLPADPLSRTKRVRGTLLTCLADLPGSMNLHAKTPTEFESDLTPLYLDICVDGICLVGEGYFEPLRSQCLTALNSSRMKRQRVGGSLFWMLPDGGARNWELTWGGYRERT
jgi:predicted nucleotidyltransferase